MSRVRPLWRDRQRVRYCQVISSQYQIRCDLESFNRCAEIPMSISEISELLKTQDNRATADPMFVVFEKKRIWGMDSNYCDESKWMNLEHDGQEADDEQVAEIEKKIADAVEDGEILVDLGGWEKVYYIDVDRFVVACLTEKAALDYIVANSHRLFQPFVYATSNYRNHEMIEVRNHLIANNEMKAIEYYRAALMKKRPKWVPSRIRLVKQVSSSIPGINQVGFEPGDYESTSNQFGAVGVKMQNGKSLGVRQDEFIPVAWVENPHQ